MARASKSTWFSVGLGLLVLLGLTVVVFWLLNIPEQTESTVLIKAAAAIVAICIMFYLVAFRNASPLIKQLVNKQTQLDEIEARFIAASESHLDAFFILEAVRDESGEIVDFRCAYLNHHACKLVGREQGEYIGSWLNRNFILLQNEQAFQRYCEVVETGRLLTYEFQDDTLKLKPRWLECQLIKLGDGIALTARDITDKKRTEHDLVHAERFQSAIIDSVSYSIIATDKVGNIITMNNAAQRMLWFEETDLVGKFTLEMLHDPEEIKARALELSAELGCKIEPGFEVFVAKSRAGLSDEHEWTYVRKGGSRFP
ncbi:MAG: PAS domain-containing protein, partial [Nitrosomonadales bacterium]|nr:PAS domain-containing protein [Nitrosomonadales bacterium]